MLSTYCKEQNPTCWVEGGSGSNCQVNWLTTDTVQNVCSLPDWKQRLHPSLLIPPCSTKSMKPFKGPKLCKVHFALVCLFTCITFPLICSPQQWGKKWQNAGGMEVLELTRVQHDTKCKGAQLWPSPDLIHYYWCSTSNNNKKKNPSLSCKDPKNKRFTVALPRNSPLPCDWPAASC